MGRAAPTRAEALAMAKPARDAAGRPPPEHRIEPAGPGEESVWDYPRPPRVEPVEERVEVALGGVAIAASERALRVLETAGAPTVYLPPEDIAMEHLEPAEGWSLCEWKGIALYYDVIAGGKRPERAAWCYPEPFDDLGQGYHALAGWICFYPGKLDCRMDGERVRPQPGGFYGGWVTDKIKGPIKGEPGSQGW